MNQSPKLTPTFHDQHGGNGAVVPVPTMIPWQQFHGAIPLAEQPVPPIPVVEPSHQKKGKVGRPKKKSRTIEVELHSLPQQPVFIPAPIPVVEPPPLKVALIGTAPSSRMMAPFADPSWQIWGCSPGNQGILPRVDAWFEIHGNLLWPECISYGAPYIEWLKQQKFPIYMQDQSLVPNALTYPKAEAVKEFGRYFMTSSFSWMIAKAIMDGAKEIALYGIDMASRNEYILQRPGAYFFFHECAKRGIKIGAPHESDIMQPPGLYGYAEVTPLGRKIQARKSELTGRLAPMRQQRDSLIQNITYLEGALEDADYFEAIWQGAQEG